MTQPFSPRRLSRSVDDHSSPPLHAPHPPPSPATRWLAILLLLVAAALVVMVVRQQHDSGPGHQVAEPRTVAPRGDLAADEQATISLFQKASPSVVQITSLQAKRSRISFNVFEIPQGTGSGLVWDEHGHVVTNYHVIQNADRAEVSLADNSVWSANIVGVAPDKDLAVLRIDAPAGKLHGLAVGTSADLQVGQKVFAIGNPFGLDQTLTTGVISGLGREIQSVTRRPIYDVIQTDAAINRGNSGGPLLDSHGRLIGVNTAIYSPSGASAGVGFAVPVDTVNRIVPQLIQHGRIVRPGLGIHIGNDQLATQLNLQGILVIDVPADSAAGNAGLEGAKAAPSGRWILGDIIVAVDGEAVRNSSDLYRVLDQREVGDTVTLTVDRNGKRRDIDVQLQPLP